MTAVTGVMRVTRLTGLTVPTELISLMGLKRVSKEGKGEEEGNVTNQCGTTNKQKQRLIYSLRRQGPHLTSSSKWVAEPD